jgi:serine/threonine protein kinase
VKWTEESPHAKPGVSFEGTGPARQTEDFELIGLLGGGAYSRVALAQKKSTGGHCSSEEMFVLKFVRNDRVSKIEKEVLLRAVGHPFLVQFLEYFHTKEFMCYVMEFIEGGSLRLHLRKHKRFSEDLTRFFAAELILAVNFLHNCGIVHWDIKPENILLDKNGHCKLADFGLCEVGMFTASKTSVVCGTTEYTARFGLEEDWWAVGCVIYEMLLGKCRDLNVRVTRERFPKYLSHNAVSLLKKFLTTNPRRRLGVGGDTRAILRHPFFKKVNWKAVLEKRVAPPANPLTLNFVIDDPAASGDADDPARNPSMENKEHEEETLQGKQEDMKEEELLLQETDDDVNEEGTMQGEVELMEEEELLLQKREDNLHEEGTMQGEVELMETVTGLSEHMYRDIFRMEICFMLCALALFGVGYICINI